MPKAASQHLALKHQKKKKNFGWGLKYIVLYPMAIKYNTKVFGLVEKWPCLNNQ